MLRPLEEVIIKDTFIRYLDMLDLNQDLDNIMLSLSIDGQYRKTAFCKASTISIVQSSHNLDVIEIVNNFLFMLRFLSLNHSQDNKYIYLCQKILGKEIEDRLILRKTMPLFVRMNCIHM